VPIPELEVTIARVGSALRLLAIDIGAESGRAVVGSFDGQRLTMEEVHRFANVPVRMGGILYWDFPRIFGDVLDSIAKAGAVATVGVDTWGVDFGLLDARGRLLSNPVHYRDARTIGMLQRATERVPREEIYAATGIQFMEINTLYQLFALAESADPDLERAERLLLMPDLIHHFLSGSTVGEFTNATTTQCFDPRQGAWATEVLSRLGIPARLFPEVVQPGTVLGPLLADVGPTSARLVATATHDTASAVAAIPLPDPTTAYLSCGTWSLIGLELQEPLINEAALAANVTNEGGVAGTTRLLRNVMGLWLVQEARRAIDRSGADLHSYEVLTAAASTAPAFSAFIDPDDPRFLRPGDLPSAVASFCQATEQRPPQDTGTLVRVLLESLALKYAVVVDTLSELTGTAVTAIHMVGGGTRNELLCQLTANATALPVIAGAVESTAVGNLLVQAIALGELTSLAEARELVKRTFPVREYLPDGDWSEPRARFERLLGEPLPTAC
jgi:rhamnulokinase